MTVLTAYVVRPLQWLTRSIPDRVPTLLSLDPQYPAETVKNERLGARQ